MMQQPKLLQNTAIYTIVMVLQKGVSFFLLPLYTIFLTPADYGIIGVSSSITSFLSIFLTLSLGAAANRFYYSHHKDEDYSSRLYGTIACIILINSVFFGGIFILCHTWIIDPFLGNIPFFPYILLGLLNVIITPLYLLFQEYLQTRQNGIYYGINSMCFFVLNVGLTIIGLSVLNWGVVGVLLANLITSAVFFVYAAVVFGRKMSFKIDRVIAKEAFAYSLPLIPHQLTNWSNGTVDRLLINGLKSEADTGLYNLGQQYSSVMGLITNAINQAYVPWFYDKVNIGKTGYEQIIKVAEALVYVMSFIALAMSLYSKDVLDIMISNPEYDGIWRIIPLLVAGYLFHGLYFFFINVLYLKNPKKVFTVSLLSFAANIGLNIIFIPIWGCMGSALAFFLTYLLQSIFALILSTIQNKEIKFPWFRFYTICTLSLLVSLIPLFLDGISGIFLFIAKTALVIVVFFFLYFKYKPVLLSLIKANN